MVNATLTGTQIQSNKVNIRKRVIMGPWNIALAQDSKVLHFTYKGIKQFQIAKDNTITVSEPYIPTNDSMTFSTLSSGGSPPPSTVYGCTNNTAMNYLPSATAESGSGSTCIFSGTVGGTVLWNLMLITSDFGIGNAFPNNTLTDNITIKENVSDASSLLTSTPGNGSGGFVNFNLKDNATYKIIMTNPTTKNTYIYNFNKPTGVTTGQTLTLTDITLTEDNSSPIDGTPSS
jgi:hypothetical protein